MKTCTECGYQNEDAAEKCSRCGKPLASSLSSQAESDLRDPALDPVIIATFENTEHAGVLKAELDAAGIEAWIPEDFSIEFPPQTVSIQVATKDAAAAGEIADEFRKARGLNEPPPRAPTSPEPRTATGIAVPNTRPCVSCGAAISYDAARCPACGWTQPQWA